MNGAYLFSPQRREGAKNGKTAMRGGLMRRREFIKNSLVAGGGEKEEIVGDAEPNKLLSRPCRAPWKYPAFGVQALACTESVQPEG